MTKQAEKIEKLCGKKLVGKRVMKNSVTEALTLLPSKMIDYLTKKVWFVSSFDDAWGFVLTGEEIGNQHLIFLSDDLFAEDKAQIRYTILHEVGHVILNHHNSILEQQTKREIEKQEKEADEFAHSYLEFAKVG